MTVHTCRHCESPLQDTVIDLGHQPPSNAYLRREQLSQPEITYPLQVFVCTRCWLVQLPAHATSEELFTPDYAYFSSTSSSWCSHAERFVAAAVERLHDRSNKAAELVAEQHNARWAVAYWAMAHRAVAYRRRYGAAIMAGVTRDVERYGHPHRVVAAHAERLDPNRSLRQILEPGGAVAQLVERVLPGATARADIVARDGNLTATGAA